MSSTTFSSIQLAADPARSLDGRNALPRRLGWLQAFVLFELFCQVALLLPMFRPVRMFVRVAVFAASLLLLFVVPGRVRPQRAAKAAAVALGIVALALLNPHTSLVAGVAQAAMYAAVLAPLFWVARARIGAAELRAVLLLLWGFHTASAAVGVLQVTFPGKFQPQVSEIVRAHGDWYLREMMITLENGDTTFRPMGLTDQPGGASFAGLYATVLGLGLFFTARRPELRVACLASMVMGLFCIYLSQVRSVLIISVICAAVFAVVCLRRGELGRFTVMAVVVAGIACLSFWWATSIAGKAVTGRVQTLMNGNVRKVYYDNRGRFLEQTLTVLLPRYPLGAGLGRWGMMNYYFEHSRDPDDAPIWVEIQWTGWLLDGGVPLIVAYVCALGLASLAAWRVALHCGGELGIWGGLIFAYNVGALALTFAYPLFQSQSGLEVWFLNAALVAAAQRATSRRAPKTSPAS